MSMDCAHIAGEARERIEACVDHQALEELRVRYLGRRGVVADLMSKIPALPAEERRSFGSLVNCLKNDIAQWIAQRQGTLSLQASPAAGSLDITLPGKQPLQGRLHPLTQVKREICATFQGLGFKIFEGPEIETEFNNFEALNIPLEHPSRDAFDTFYIKSQVASSMSQEKTCDLKLGTWDRFLLRSHTSPVQIRAMKECKPPVAMVFPGKVYRPDAVDASHSFEFHQVEGMAVDKDIRFSDLKGILLAFAREMFGSKTKIRFRPSFFPFTEPSAEVDISCILCQGQGCPVCKKSGWLEILGCGMIHPHVFKSVGYDGKVWRGFAFGMGVERIAMLKFGIKDIRLFFENDMRFLEQF